MVVRFTVFYPAKIQLLRVLMLPLLLLFVCIDVSISQCVLSCNQNVQVSLDQTGSATILPQIIAPYAAFNCTGTLDLTLYNPQNTAISNVLDCAYLNSTITAKVTHQPSGNICYGSIVVKDFLAPVIQCADTFVVCTQDLLPEQVGFPEFNDNCTPLTTANLTYSDENIDLACTTLQDGRPVTAKTVRTWSVSDQQGASATCSQTIWIKRATLADVSFPANLDGFSQPALNCGENPNDLSLTGQPLVGGRPVLTDATCDLLVGFTDTRVNGCSPASYRVLRNWTVSDYCSNTFTIHVQVIKVDDKTPPVLNALSNITVGTNGTSCAASVTLPQANGYDNCSTFSVTPSWAYGSGYGPHNNVPTGQHTVKYTASDGCGNSTTVTMLVNVVDDDAPSVVCATNIQMNLSQSGTALLNASALNQGSTDNCGGTLQFRASRDGADFTPQVSLTCADKGTTVPVTLKVIDAVGLENTCIVQVLVNDNLKPTLQCPSNASLTCLDASTLPDVTGNPLVSDNCGVPTVTYTDSSDLSSCNTGSIIRTWKATDSNGNFQTCSQLVTVNLVNTLSVQFPSDITVSSCAQVLDLDPNATGRPLLTGLSCSTPAVQYTDQNLPAPPACFNIQRRWKVYDWCVYDPNLGSSSPGYWQFTQIIRVFDNNPPAFPEMPDVTVQADLPGCKASVVLPELQLTDCSANVTVSNNSQFAAGQGANATGEYPVGTHTVEFTASDACGNSATKSMKITVVDQSAPNAACNSVTSINLGVGGTVTLNAQQIGAGSADNCTPFQDLAMTVFPTGFSCATLGVRAVTLIVSDAAGNSDTCQTSITVLDNGNYCLPTNFEIGGTIKTPGNVPVSNIPVVIVADGYREATAGNASGVYGFSDIPANLTYVVRPENRNLWLNGVTTFDLLQISKHLLGVQVFNSPYKIIAADANKSGTVTTFDIVQLRKMILGIIDTLPGNSSWRFVDAGFTFTNPDDPLSVYFPEEIRINNLNASHTNKDFIGIKVGDVNWNADAANARSPHDTIYIGADNVLLKAGETLPVPVKLNSWQEVEGFQFELKIDTSKVRIKDILLPESKYFKSEHLSAEKKAKGILTVSWDNAKAKIERADTLLFTLVLEPTQDVYLKEVMALNTQRIAAEAYLKEEEHPALIDLRVGKLPLRNMPFEVGQNVPNPFCSETYINVKLPEDDGVTLTVTDAFGRVVFVKKQNLLYGNNTLLLRQEEIGSDGIFFYQIKTDKAQIIKGGKMIVQKK